VVVQEAEFLQGGRRNRARNLMKLGAADTEIRLL